MPVRVNDRTVRESLSGQDSYALLFAFLIFDYLVLILVASPRWGGLARTVPVAVTVLFALHTAGARPALVRAALAAVALSVVGGLAQVADPNGPTKGVAAALVAVLLILTPVAILRRVLPQRRVTIEILFAALDIYVIIGLIFATVFIALARFFPTAPIGPFLAQSGTHTPSDYVYLSFVTLTTVGFGDLTPRTDLARSVVVMEALIGQLFLVTLVARLVSMYNSDAEPSRFLSREPSARRGRRGAAPGAAEDGDPGGDRSADDDAGPGRVGGP